MTDLKSIILFDIDSVKAVMNGIKTQRRRPITPQPTDKIIPSAHGYKKNEILWVREPFKNKDGGFLYAADDESKSLCWRSPIFMPKDAARIFLKITKVDYQKLHEISDDDLMREGYSDVYKFIDQWNSVNSRCYSYDKNPYVWVINFMMV